jgi:hypothetical protein
MKNYLKPGMLPHACNPYYSGDRDQDHENSLGKQRGTILSNKNLA